MPELKYSYDSLQKFCEENGIELCKDYSQELVRRETKIEGKCKTDGCIQIFNKVFRELKQNMTPYCSKCVYKISVEKRKITFLEKYGVEHSLQYDIFKNKAKQTSIINYGVVYPSQSQEIKNKIKETSLKNWGVEHPSQNEEIKKKKIQTSLKNWGVEYTLQNEIIKKKGVETSLRKYGVKNPIQDPLIAEKALNGYNTKYYIFPSGKTIKYQGYENMAFDELLKNISEYDIVTSRTDVPTIWYTTDDNIKHRHYVDIFIPKQNRCIEVKSVWTIKYVSSNIFMKQPAAKDLGYKYEIWVYNKKCEKINCYE